MLQTILIFRDFIIFRIKSLQYCDNTLLKNKKINQSSYKMYILQYIN